MTDPRRVLAEVVADLRAYLENEAAEGVAEVDVNPALLEAAVFPRTFTREGEAATTPAAPSAQSGGGPVVPPPKVSVGGERGAAQTAGAAMETLEEIRANLGDCRRCRLCEGRKNIVFGVGNPNADLVIVGEAPGRDEDIQGEPFVGRAGQLLTRMLAAIGLRREDVYICNVIKCRPPENRNPLPDEVASCEPFLIRQIHSMRPKVILAMGKFAAQTLLKTEERISSLRGQFREYQGIPLMPTFHPAYLLRNESQKRVVWEDLQKVHQALGLPPIPSAPRSRK
ncbi:MAG: uracil-DNA glycosylase [Candidatus Tectomicrobia bacterium]|nr:uracil-DNA glycosylase [Candidatus Tectomicrobia bacterium]